MHLKVTPECLEVGLGLVSVTAVPLAAIVVPLVCEARGDPVLTERARSSGRNLRYKAYLDYELLWGNSSGIP